MNSAQTVPTAKSKTQAPPGMTADPEGAAGGGSLAKKVTMDRRPFGTGACHFASGKQVHSSGETTVGDPSPGKRVIYRNLPASPSRNGRGVFIFFRKGSK